MTRFISTWRACLLAAMLGSLPFPTWADEVDNAIALLRQGKAGEAYRLLLPLAEKQPRDLRTTVMLGISALDSGYPDAAITAFERALQQDARLTAVRADVARAYLAVGRYGDARRELKQAMASNPPEQALPVLESLLAVAEAGAHIEKYGVLTGFIEAGLGHDSNVTTVTANFTGGIMDAYGLPGFQPTGNSIMRSAVFSQITAGADYVKPLNREWAFTAGLNGSWRGYNNYSAYNQTSADLRLGALFARERHIVRLNLDAQRYDQQTEAPGNPPPTANRRSSGLSADWRYDLDPFYNTGIFVAANQMRFPDNRVLDADQTQVGLSLTRRFTGPSNGSVTLSPSYTADHALNTIPGSATGANYSKTAIGARLSGQFDPAANVTAFASFGLFERRDGSDFSRSTLVARGIDTQNDVSIGANWRFAPNWSMRVQASRTDNRSNIALYSYGRTEAFVGVRRDFR